MAEIQLVPLETSDREQFIRDNQEAFNYGAMEEFGLRDTHFEDKDDEQIISSKTIEACIAFLCQPITAAMLGSVTSPPMKQDCFRKI